MSWRRLKILIEGLPRESRLVRSIDPSSVWGPEAHLLASAVDLLQGANWQRGGGKGSRPRPVKRPGRDDGSKQLGKARPLSEVSDLFERWRNGQVNATEGKRSHIHKRKGVTHGG